MWSGIWSLATTRIGFWIWIWSTRQSSLRGGGGAVNGLLISMLERLNWFCLNGLIKLVLLMWKYYCQVDTEPLEKTWHFLRKKVITLQIKPTFWWIKELSLKKNDWNFRIKFREWLLYWNFARKKLANSQISVFQVITFGENVRNSRKLRKFPPL